MIESIRLDPLSGRLARLSASGVYFGTSSWKYPGWLGSLYTRDRYIWRGRFSSTRFERLCLSEYGETFKTVCVDAAYYTFPTERGVRELGALVPDEFRFAFKVTGDITIKRFPALDRFGTRAGRENENFLNPRLFTDAFLAPCAALGPKLGLVLFEFSRFQPGEFGRGREFVERLEAFLAQLPAGVRYGVEIRNATFLHPEYFETLARHGVAHVFNSWNEMPPVTEQMHLAEGLPTAPFTAARFLLKPGRTYADAVQRFSPYDRIQEPYAEGVEAGVRLAQRGLQSSVQRPAFLYVNNRFEGNAPQTIRRMLDGLEDGATPGA
ncbi:MAG: DUF72 domain-containing protein [Verrucomicrobia bacterium]|jgi:uncharacterized protein YecE (DUF72 family)|nr:DUF72 domain-containing protein [Verrucomicrobiota bacterium]